MALTVGASMNTLPFLHVRLSCRPIYNMVSRQNYLQAVKQEYMIRVPQLRTLVSLVQKC